MESDKRGTEGVTGQGGGRYVGVGVIRSPQTQFIFGWASRQDEQVAKAPPSAAAAVTPLLEADFFWWHNNVRWYFCPPLMSHDLQPRHGMM